jgi:hypothetical protein
MENPVVQLLAVLGSASSWWYFWSGSFRGRIGVDTSEEGICKRTGGRRRFTKESQYAEQTSLITSTKAFFAGVLF